MDRTPITGLPVTETAADSDTALIVQDGRTKQLTVGTLSLQAKAWAESVDEPGEPGTKSAKTWAGLAEGFADDASDSADAAATSAAQAALYDGVWLDDAPAVIADTSLSYGPGASGVSEDDYVRTRAEGFSYQVAAEDADPFHIVTNPTGYHVITAGGVKLYVLRGELGYHVDAFGAVNDGVTDSVDQIEAAADAVAAEGGGTLVFGQGMYRTTREITIPTRQLRMVGTGRRMPYPGDGLPLDVDGPSTIYADHALRNAFRFTHVTEQSTGFSAHGINVITNDSGVNRPTAAFGFDTGGIAALFQRDFTFERCGMFNFTSAFDLYNSGGTDLNQFGVIKIFDCAINRNSWIARTLDGSNWNGFTFRDNEAGQQLVGGIDIEAHSFVCNDNLMEGQPNPIKVTGAYRNLVIKGNYFEAVSGRACIELQQCLGPIDLGPNLYIVVTADHKVLLGGTGNTLSHDPYWPEGVINTPLPMLGKASGGDTERVLNTDVSTSDYGYYRTDKGDLSQFTKKPTFSTSAPQRVTVGAREISPTTGNPMPVQEYTTSGSGSVPLSYTIAGGVGDYVVASWLMRQIADASDTASPYISFAINGGAGLGGRDYSFTNHPNYVVQGDWVLMTAAVRLTGAMSSLSLSLFPFGVSPTAGRVARFLRPMVYVTDNVNRILPYIDNYMAESVTATPGAGTWLLGDTVKNATPAGGNQSRFCCTTAGTPGAWSYG